jgi:hypothetical protein
MTSWPFLMNRFARNWPKFPKPTMPIFSVRFFSTFCLCFASKSNGCAASSARGVTGEARRAPTRAVDARKDACRSEESARTSPRDATARRAPSAADRAFAFPFTGWRFEAHAVEAPATTKVAADIVRIRLRDARWYVDERGPRGRVRARQSCGARLG